ncbi:hypothetical protein C9I90_09900 [Photobacterium aphoticum]|uniref:Uncharacterized protein n=2 Tax=Photobacterium aphoticum TaxID=754436 RepID=A0A0J1GFK8_9GAMM|nr:hypothetical protein ABT58_22650 [Photobacterium aphoticum]PSU57435.1 hypothetical protein C9I90_09900 [Photobacterium aphoticum]
MHELNIRFLRYEYLTGGVGKMGKVFELIADGALKESTYSDECAFCGAKDRPIYNVTGFAIESEQFMFQDIPEELEEFELDGACTKCFKDGKIKLFSEEDLEPILEMYCDDPYEQLKKIRGTPTIPLFMQGMDWVSCCGVLCEFMGSPDSYRESIALVETHKFWDKGPKDWN